MGLHVARERLGFPSLSQSHASQLRHEVTSIFQRGGKPDEVDWLRRKRVPPSANDEGSVTAADASVGVNLV